MTRSVPDETADGSAEELRRDAVQYAGDASARVDEVDDRHGTDHFGGDGEDIAWSVRLVADAVSANTAALLSVSARLGQVAAVLAERFPALPTAMPRGLFRDGEGRYIPVRDDGPSV